MSHFLPVQVIQMRAVVGNSLLFLFLPQSLWEGWTFLDVFTTNRSSWDEGILESIEQPCSSTSRFKLSSRFSPTRSFSNSISTTAIAFFVLQSGKYGWKPIKLRFLTSASFRLCLPCIFYFGGVSTLTRILLSCLPRHQLTPSKEIHLGTKYFTCHGIVAKIVP